MLTFEQFIATRREVADLAAEDLYAEGPGFVYQDELFIEGKEPNLILNIEASSQMGTLTELEPILYDFYALCNTGYVS